MIYRNQISGISSTEIVIQREDIEKKIDELKKQLKKAKKQLKHSSLEGIPKGQGMIYTSFLPIGVGILTKILFGLNDSIVQVLNMPLKESTLISLYLTIHCLIITFGLSCVSNSYYKECQRKRESYESVIEYLTQEIKFQKSKLEALSKDDTLKEEISDHDYYNRSIARKKMIRNLLVYRNKLNRGFYIRTVDEYISELGITEEEKASFQNKRFIISKKQKLEK